MSQDTRYPNGVSQADLDEMSPAQREAFERWLATGYSNRRLPGTIGEASERLHDAAVRLWEALPSTPILRSLVDWLSKRLP